MAAYWNLVPILLQLLVVVNCQKSPPSPANPPASRANDPNIAKTKQVYLYRLINWCIAGRGEYALNEWPLSQFKPILHHTYKNEKQHLLDMQKKIDVVTGGTNVNPWDKFDLFFNPIACEAMDNGKLGLGDGKSNFLQRLHIQFKPKNKGDAYKFQGLMIQAVHAPFGLGFPFGVFDTDSDFECTHCEHLQFCRIIGCLSRPDFAAMHPTVALYHYKLRRNKKFKVTGGSAGAGTGGNPVEIEKEVDNGYQTELHWNFRWANLPCSSAQLVEFWVLMVLDFERRAWTIKKFGPYDFNKLEYASPLNDPVKVKVGQFEWTQPGLPSPVFPICYPFMINPIVPNELGRPHTCFRNYKSYDPVKCQRWESLIRSEDRPPAPPPPTGQNPAPAPPPPNVHNLFKFVMNCHGKPEFVPPVITGKTRVRVVGDFDVQCTRRYPGKFYEQAFSKIKRQPHKICPEWQGKMICDGKFSDLQFDTNFPDEGSTDVKRAFPGSHCVTCKPVTEEVTQAPSDELPFFKRGEHGVLMIYAFFFFNPVSLNVARFYKETLHEKQLKGWRLWLVIHVGFAVFASIFSYIGYTYPSFTELDAHIVLGYGAMIGVCSGVLTGWFRHKTSCMNDCMIYIHALSGYLGWGLAIASMVFAPFISKWTRLVSYMASGICLAAMAIMTLHICTVDTKIGMRPKRSHIPIIEIRFDDIVPPRSSCRKIFLYVYIFLQFLICFGMLVL